MHQSTQYRQCQVHYKYMIHIDTAMEVFFNNGNWPLRRLTGILENRNYYVHVAHRQG
jgi:hypothetical protein